MTSKPEEGKGPTWAAWLQAQLDAQGLNPFSLAERASEKLGRRVHASSIQRQLSGERGIQHELANAIAAGLGLPQSVVHVAAGIKTEVDPADMADPKLQMIYQEVREISTKAEADAELDALLLLIRAYKAGRGASSKPATTTKRARGRTDALVPAG